MIENRVNRRRFVRLALTGTAALCSSSAFAKDPPKPKAAPVAAVAEQPAQAEGDMVLGKPDAPVEIIAYASMTCTHCAAFELKTLPELKTRYIEPGKVKLVFREFPLDAVAVRAAMLARCAGPERYFGVIQLLFQQQAKWATAKDPVAALKRVGQIAGISAEQFDACMADNALMDRVVKTRLDAEQQYKIESTPSFVIGGKVHSGEMPIDTLAKLLDPLLAKS